MKIADRTPFRNDSGQIDIMGRIQGTLKYGLSWYARLQAQETVIAVLGKVLGQNFVLLRNVTLPNTDIDLPLVLIGPPGIYLINVAHERGVYQARDDEWGTVSAEKFVPAGINIIQRTSKLGRVLQIYLDRAGYKGQLIVDPILMAANPGMHIDSIRPAVRIVMSDALERFAISMNQAREVLRFDTIKTIARVIVNGPKSDDLKENSTAPFVDTPLNSSASGNSTWDAGETLINPIPQPESSQAFSADSLGFSFDDSAQDEEGTFSQDTLIQGSAPAQKTLVQNAPMQDTIVQQPARMESGHEESSYQAEWHDGDAEPAGASATQTGPNSESDQAEAVLQAGGEQNNATWKKKRLLGMSTKQVAVLAGILLCWLCVMAAFAAYISFSN